MEPATTKNKKQFDYPTLLLVEHGETEFTGSTDRTDRIHGTKYDHPLTLEGHRQAAAVAEKLKDYDIASLNSSPQLRAKETAEHISKTTGVTAKEDDDLKPLDAGYLSGMTHDNAKRRMEYYVKNPHKEIPGGQAYGEWFDNASNRMARRLKETQSAPEGKANVDVLHSSEIASMPNIIKGEGPSVWSRQIPGPGRISAVVKRNGKWSFVGDWDGSN